MSDWDAIDDPIALAIFIEAYVIWVLSTLYPSPESISN